MPQTRIQKALIPWDEANLGVPRVPTGAGRRFPAPALPPDGTGELSAGRPDLA